MKFSLYRKLTMFLTLTLLSCGAPVGGPQGSSNCPENTACTDIHWDEDENGQIVVTPPPLDNTPPDTPPLDDITDDPFDDEEVIDDGGIVIPDDGPGDNGGIGGHNGDSDGNLSDLGNALGLGLKNLFKGIAGLGSVLSGEAQNKAREALNKKQEIQRKIKEAQSLAERIKEYEGQITDLTTGISDKGKAISGEGHHGEASTNGKVNEAGKSHNEMVDEVNEQIPEFNPTPPKEDEDKEDDNCLLRLKNCDDLTPEDEKVITSREYIDYARNRVQSFEGAQKKGAEKILDTADATTDLAEDAYNQGDLDEGDAYTSIALGLADAAIGFVPGLGWAHDVYQAVSGENLITGEQLDNFDRSMALLGAMSGGILSKLNHVVKGSKILRRLGKADNVVKNPDDYKDALKKADDWEKSGFDDDTIDSILDNAGDCLVSHTWTRPVDIINSILGLVEDTAYAAGKKPCEQIVDEVVDSAKKSAPQFEADIAKLPPGERVAKVKGVAAIKASQNGWTKNNQLKKRNKRDIYTDRDGTQWGVDTQHGRWEKFNKKTGKHEGEYNFDGEKVKPAVPGRKILI